MTQIRKAVWFSILSQYSLTFVGLVSIAVLARLLTPGEIGVFAVATAIAFIGSSIRNFGVSEYLIREKVISPIKVKSVLGVMIIISWGLGGLLLATAPWIADYYGVSDLRDILWIMSGPFFLAPYTSIPHALLSRELDFKSILCVDLTGALVNAGTSIGLVILGYSYFGLAFGALFGVVGEFLAISILRPANMSWLPTFKEFGNILRVGFFITVGRTFAIASQNVTDLVLGRMAQMSDVGYYSRGLGLVVFIQNLLVHSVGPTALPHLSQVNRSGGDVAEAYVNSQTLIGAFTFPVFAVVNLAAGPMIIALFGDQWERSVSIASILAIWAMLQSVHCFSNPALLAVGRERVMVFKEAMSITVKIALIILAVPHGLDWVAWSFLGSGVFDLVMITLLLRWTHGIRITQMARSYLSNVIVAASCWVTLKSMSLAINFDRMNAWLALVIIGLAMTVVWLLALKLTRNRAWPYIWDVVTRPWNKRLAIR